MGIRQKFYNLLSRGEPEDPDQLIEIAVVPIGVGPMTVASLCDDGFSATGNETFNLVTKVASDYRILVPRRESDRATIRLNGLA